MLRITKWLRSFGGCHTKILLQAFGVFEEAQNCASMNPVLSQLAQRVGGRVETPQSIDGKNWVGEPKLNPDLDHGCEESMDTSVPEVFQAVIHPELFKDG